MNNIVKTYNTELYHVGVKGMKWGVRKKSFAPTTKSKYDTPDPFKLKDKNKWRNRKEEYARRRGINPGSPKAPMGATYAVENSRSTSIKKGAKAVGKALGTVGLMGITAVAGAAGATYVGYKVVSKLWNNIRDVSPILW